MKLALGIIAASAAAILMNYGSFLMKLALRKLPRIGSEGPLATVRSFTGNRTWLTGQGAQLSGALFDNMAVALAPLSIVQPINAAGISVLVVLAITRLREKASPVDWLGIISIGVGVVLLGVSLFSTPGETRAHSPLLTWFFLILGFVVAGYSLLAAFRSSGERASALLGVGAGIIIGLTAVLQKLGWREAGDRWGEFKVAAIIYSWPFWVALGLAVLSLVLYQVALQRGRALVVVPLVAGMSNLIPIAAGFIAFREPLPTTGLMTAFRLVSMLLVVVGAVLLSLRPEGTEPQARRRRVTVTR